MNKYLSKLGYHGPNILLILIFLTFASQHITSPYIYLLVIVWQMASHLLNITIKNILQIKRPDSDKDPNFASLKPTFANYLTIHRNYGMPSGHAQSTISELTFIALYFKKPVLTVVALVQTCLTLWQRYETRRHSPIQLLAGSLLGVVVGWGFYLYFKTVINYETIDDNMVTAL